ncbi:MAG: MJ0042-type zinc finger domain-containing protein [Acidobacteriota bacterium]
MATCPECDADLDVDESDVEEGDQVDCPECGETFVVTGTDPLELEIADEDEDEEEEEEEEDDADLDDEDDVDEDDEDEGDWDE